MDKLTCPVCGAFVPHDHGYLETHTRSEVRGDLTTGNLLCEGSNSRVSAPLRTITYSGICPGCNEYLRVDQKEDYPGSLTQYGGTITVQHCSTEDFGGIQIVATLHDSFVIAESA